MDDNYLGRDITFTSDLFKFDSVYTGRKKAVIESIKTIMKCIPLLEDISEELIQIYSDTVKHIKKCEYTQAMDLVRKGKTLTTNSQSRYKRGVVARANALIRHESVTILEHLSELNDNLERVRST